MKAKIKPNNMICNSGAKIEACSAQTPDKIYKDLFLT